MRPLSAHALAALAALLLPASALAADADGDGVTDTTECARDGVDCGAANDDCPDTDGDGTRDPCDSDDDGDGIPSRLEGLGDPDRDGTPSYRDEDADGDGVLDVDEGYEQGTLVDRDCDQNPDFLDPVNDGACISRTSSTVSLEPASALADGQDAIVAVVDLRGEDGSAIGEGYAVTVGAVFEEPPGIARAQANAAFDDERAAYVAELRSATVGRGHLEVQVGALQLAAQPAFAFLGVDALDPAASTVEASAPSAPADGDATIEIAVSLRNAAGVLLVEVADPAQLAAQLDVEAPAELAAPLALGDDGVFRASLRSERPATILVRASARGPREDDFVRLAGGATVEFVGAVFLELSHALAVDRAASGETVPGSLAVSNVGRADASGYAVELSGDGLVPTAAFGPDGKLEELAPGRFALPAIAGEATLPLTYEALVTAPAGASATLAATVLDPDGRAAAGPLEASLRLSRPPFAEGCALPGAAFAPLFLLGLALGGRRRR